MYSVDDTKSYFPVTRPLKTLKLFENLKFTCLNYFTLNVYLSSKFYGLCCFDFYLTILSVVVSELHYRSSLEC